MCLENSKFRELEAQRNISTEKWKLEELEFEGI